MAGTPAVPEQTAKASTPAFVPFDFSQPPLIDGFNPSPKAKDDTFKEKFIRKTKENPFVPIGELHNVTAVEISYTSTNRDGTGGPLM